MYCFRSAVSTAANGPRELPLEACRLGLEAAVDLQPDRKCLFHIAGQRGGCRKIGGGADLPVVGGKREGPVERARAIDHVGRPHPATAVVAFAGLIAGESGARQPAKVIRPNLSLVEPPGHLGPHPLFSSLDPAAGVPCRGMLRIVPQGPGQEPHRLTAALREGGAFGMGSGSLDRQREEPLGPLPSRGDKIPPDRFTCGRVDAFRHDQPRGDLDHDDPIGGRWQLPPLDQSCQGSEILLGRPLGKHSRSGMPLLSQSLLAGRLRRRSRAHAGREQSRRDAERASQNDPGRSATNGTLVHGRPPTSGPRPAAAQLSLANAESNC